METRGVKLIPTREADCVITTVRWTDNNDATHDRSVSTGTYKVLTLRLQDVGTEHDYGDRHERTQRR